MARPHVVIVGGGFGGLSAAQALAGKDVDVTLVDRQNHHLFQPLLYQVATAGLSPADIASPIRSILRHAENVRMVLADVLGFDTERRRVELGSGDALRYDWLIVSVGVQTNYFGHPEWSRHAVGLKDLDEALEIRRRVLVAFEEAERRGEPGSEKLLTFVAIGGGPTGVEIAGAFAELSRTVLARDFRSIDPAHARVVLVEAGPRLLPSFHESLSAAALDQLHSLGVEVRLGARVTKIDAQGVEIGDERIDCETVVWAAGVSGNPVVSSLGAPMDRGGRVLVKDDCTIPGHPEVFVIGDTAAFREGDGWLPGVAQVAMQQAVFATRIIEMERNGARGVRTRFAYRDLGSMATIGRSAAIAEIGPMRWTGLFAWLVWLFVHLIALIGFRNRASVLFAWAWSYFTYQRGARLITGHRMEAGAPPSLPRPTSRSASP